MNVFYYIILSMFFNTSQNFFLLYIIQLGFLIRSTLIGKHNSEIILDLYKFNFQ